MKMLFSAALITVFILFVLFSTAVLELFRYADTAGDPGAEIHIVTVPQGQRLKATAEDLYAKGIISDVFKFNLYARIKGYDKKIKVGEYRLSAAQSPSKILDVIVSGKVRLYKITIPEGYNLAQIAELIPAAGLGAADEFMASARDASLVKKLGVEADSFEGYLFPDTYHFPKGVPTESMIEAMVRRFRQVLKLEWERRAGEKKLTIHQTVTLASIIEKETGAPFERPIISSVFHNRLKKGMRLASDPTVIYGIKDFSGNLTRKDLITWTPYNTYKIKGLPPGPIANPGKKSLEAALFPAKTDYLFFVSKRDGTHQFSTNYEDHEKAVRKYQLRRK